MKIQQTVVMATLVFLLVFLATSCAEVQHIDACKTGHVYGFLGGLWHGIIAPVSFVGSLFSDHIAVWAVNNNGGWYSFGFLIGVGGLGFGGSKASRK